MPQNAVIFRATCGTVTLICIGCELRQKRWQETEESRPVRPSEASGTRPSIRNHPVSKDRSKEILREISSLRRDLERRLDQIELQVTAGSPRSVVAKPTPSVSSTSLPSEKRPSGAKRDRTSPEILPPVAKRIAAPRNVTVLVRPLIDLSLARAVEACLTETDGVESARLSSLSGDSAVIEAVVGPGVSVVSSLRRTLPVAFDVTESSDHAISIELASPESIEIVAEPGLEP